MTRLKKLLSIVLAMALIFTFSISAVASPLSGCSAKPLATTTQNISPQDDVIIVDEAVASAADLAAENEKNAEYLNAQNNVIMKGAISVESGIDLSTVGKVYDYADVVMVGTVNSVGISQYRSGRFFPYSLVAFSCQQVLKGEADGELEFSSLDGYVPAAEYFKSRAEKSEGKSSETGFSDDEIENGYVLVKLTANPTLQPGQQYVVFLQRGTNGGLTSIGSDYSALTVEDETYKDYEGKVQVISPSK